MLPRRVLERGVCGGFVVEAQTGFIVGFVRAVAKEAFVRENGANVSVVAYGFSAQSQRQGEKDQEDDEFAKRHSVERCMVVFR